uniref:Putative tail protein n=1 Tax=viral metagenome TaxID=1070528 RepID=A0A6M3Y3U7_9ZZZZ
MADATLTLGTLFTATFDKNFQAELRRMRTAVIEFNKAIEKGFPGLGKLGDSLERAKQGLKGIALGTETAEFGQAMGRASNQALKFQDALAYFGKGKGGAALKTVETDLYKVERAVQATSMRMDRAGISQGGYAQNVNRISLMNRVLDGNLKATSTGFTRVGKATEEVTKQKEKTATATKKVNEQYVGLNKQIAKVQGGLNRIKAAFKVTASYGIAATAIYTVIGAMKSGISEIINYDQALKNLQAITGATDAETLAMGNTIQDVARTTKFSTTEVAAGMVLLGQAGFSAGEAMDAMQATANLATGTLGDMALVTDLMTTTIRAFNLNTIESARVADVMANAINKSKLTIDKLRVAFNYVGATAAQAGLSLEETAASMMTLANNGLRASTIGTGLRQVLARMIAPNEKLREAYIDHGIAIDKITPKAGKFQEAIKYLSEVLVEADGKTVDMSKAFQLFGLRGAQAAAILVKSYLTGDFKGMLDKVYEVGTAEAMAAKQAEGLGVSLKNLADRAKLIAVALGESGVTGVLKTFIDLLAKVATGIEWLAKSIGGQMIVQFAAWTAGVWLLTKALQALIGIAIAGWIKSLTLDLFIIRTTFVRLAVDVGKFGAAWMVLRNIMSVHPFLIIAAAIGALTAGFSAIIGSTDRAIKRAQQHVVDNERAAKSLEIYKVALADLHERMNKGEDIGREYAATLSRLGKEHKELADMINLDTASYKQLMEAMKAVELEHQKAAIRGYIIQLNLLGKSIRSTIDTLELTGQIDRVTAALLQSTDIVYDTSGALDNLAKRYPRLVELIKQYRDTMFQTSKGAIGFMEATKKSRVELEELIRTVSMAVTGNEKMAEAIMVRITAALDAQTKQAIETREATEKNLLDKIPAQYMRMYEQLTAMQRAYFYRTLNQIEKQADSEETRLKDWATDVEAIAAGKEQKRLEGMKKFFDLIAKTGEMTKEETKAFLDAELKATDQWKVDTIKKVGERYAKEREEAQKATVNEEARAERMVKIKKDESDAIGNIERTHIGRRAAIESLITSLLREEIDKRMQARYEEIQRDIAAGGSRIKKLQQEEEELLKTYKWTEEQKTTIAYYYGTKRAAILAEVFDKEKQLEIESLRIQDRKIEAYDKEIEYLKGRKEGLEAQLAFDIGLDPVVARELANQINEIENKILDATRRRAEEQKRIDVEVLNERLFNIQKYSDEYTRLMEGAAAAGLVTTKELQRYYDDLIKYRAENEEKAWRLGEISAEQYFSTIEVLKRRALITDEEYYAKQAILQKGWLDNLLEGVKKAKIAVEKWNETMQKIGEQIADQFTTNLTSGLLDFVEGTKTAAQAFEDFARSTLRWLAEIIVKQTILNLLLKSFGGTNPLMEAMRGIVGMIHGGGIIGKTPLPTKMVNPMAFINAPKFGTGGIARNEIPAILHKGEGVFTEEQMKAMGGSGKPPSVNINIENNTGAGLKAKQKEVRWNGQEWVVNVWLDAYTRNAFGLRDSVGV